MRLRPLSIALAAIAFMAVGTLAAEAADGFARSSGVLRAGPGTDYPVVDSVSRGDDLEIFGCTAGYRWCDVVVDDNRGWFPGSRIAFLRDGDTVLLPEIAVTLGIGIIGFEFYDYWGRYYPDRPFYHNPRWWRGHGPIPPGHGPFPPGNNPPPPPHNPPPPPPHNPPHFNKPPFVSRPHVEQRTFQPHREPNFGNQRTPRQGQPFVCPPGKVCR